VVTSEPARTTGRRIRIRRRRLVTGALLAIAATAVLVSSKSLPPSAPTVPSLGAGPSSTAEQRDALGQAGGAVPADTTVFDDGVPAVANLDPALLRALRRAATDAAGDGVTFVVNGGWRSPAYEDQLRREAIAKYGSEAKAAQWVATGTTSAHVSGGAVDIGPAQSTPWLAERGSRYGLCRIYGNEPWHYELRPDAVARGCPAPYADPTQDPRMRR
jgi:hypothetical protein